MPATWLSPYASVWKAKFPDAVVPFGQLARSFKDLVKAHPPERIVAELQSYLDQTEPRFVSLARFVALFGTWTPKKSPKPYQWRSVDECDRAAGIEVPEP